MTYTNRWRFGATDVWGGSAQILAGEEIENQFGARLGLSTLAAAGLGNLLSDICGLGLADQIEVRATALLLRTTVSNF